MAPPHTMPQPQISNEIQTMAETLEAVQVSAAPRPSRMATKRAKRNQENSLVQTIETVETIHTVQIPQTAQTPTSLPQTRAARREMRSQQNPPVTNNPSIPMSRSEQIPPWRASRAPGRRSPQPTNSPSARESRDNKVSPSKASGGIPNPTEAYLSASSVVPQPLREAQHLLVVIDLNGTLLFRPTRKFPTKFIARPNTAPFLKYCVETFSVIIWSSAKPENVTNMCNAILTKDLRKKVIAVWGRNKFGLSDTDFNLRVQCYKRLTTLWGDPQIARSHPEYNLGGHWDQRNTVLVDDSVEKGRSEPFNLIEVPEFFGDEYEQGQILPQVHDYLNHLSMHSNVSACLRSRPFKPQTSP
ncbi:uncharacterized protein PAC_08799 [Phialocephala subalpina]|uniref:Mitochondrial import inner membrane translocase subunit TIM50 n=1 Tax=Phialocephala subalpina TaxID=576137 RepID=A0A1L7X1K5_9HELO|nr:uncharacterized protein PAC_08799 [Phialocephala subalpina]